MISEIWTIRAADGGPEKTLAELGVVDARLSRSNQDAAELTLSLAKEDAIAAPDLWVWETEVILYREGAVFYRGYVAQTPRSVAPQGESVSYVIRSHWWLLRVTYRQDWTALVGPSMGTVQTTRARLGGGKGKRRAADMVAELSAFCASVGISLSIDTSLLPKNQDLPLVEGHNRGVSELLREIFSRWHPDVVLVERYTANSTVYDAIPASKAERATFDIGDRPIESLDISSLPERQVDACEVIYEARAKRTIREESSESSVGGFRATDVLVAAKDRYPINANLTRRSLVVTLPFPYPQGQPRPLPVPQIARQAIGSETWPKNGSFDNKTEQWWIDRSDLKTMGFTVEDIRLPRSNNTETIAHRVTMDPRIIPDPPSAINPNSTVVWRPPSAKDVPRELLSGSLHEWMNVKSAMLIAEVTIAVRKSTADGLPEDKREQFQRLGPKPITLNVNGGSFAAYALDAVYKFRATNALDKVYEKVLAIDYSGGESEAVANRKAYNNAVANAVVPNLARALYEARKDLPWAGTLPLLEEEAGSESALGKVIGLTHPDRPEWATMNAQVQREEVDLVSGGTTLTFGPPEHLAPQDWVELHQAARKKQEEYSESYNAPYPNDQTGNLNGDDDEEASGQNPVIGATFSPEASFRWQSGGTGEGSKLWQLEVVNGEAGEVRISTPGCVRKTADVDNTGLIDISQIDSTFNLGVDDYIALKFTKDLEVELVQISSWEGFPWPWVCPDDSNGFKAFEEGYYPLYKGISPPAEDKEIPGVHVSINDSVTAYRCAEDANFSLKLGLEEHPDGEMVAVYALHPSSGAA